jgi:predicted nucleic acid-binding protein
MRQEYNIVIADTSCFILLDKINELDILQKLFQTVTTTEDIAAEFRKELPSWVKIKTVPNKEYQRMLLLEVDNGEASAIALSIDAGDALLIIDDNKARKLAAKLNLAFTGTLGVILKAKQSGVIPVLKPIIEKIQATNFRFSDQNYRQILHLANEG